MRKYRGTTKYKLYMKAYFKDYYKRDYAAKAKNERQNKYRKVEEYKKKKVELSSYEKYLFNIPIDIWLVIWKYIGKG